MAATGSETYTSVTTAIAIIRRNSFRTISFIRVARGFRSSMTSRRRSFTPVGAVISFPIKL